MKSSYKEEWKEYQNSGYYISSYGEVKRKLKNGRWRFLSNKAIDRYGYPKITLSINGERRTISIHRLVAELFIPNPENKPQVNHINGDKTNNRMQNLEWVTGEENMEHCFTKLHHKATRPIVRISPDMREFKLFPSVSEAARVTRLNHKTIYEAAKTFYLGGKQWKAGDYFWHFLE